jgi:hypothetical protein
VYTSRPVLNIKSGGEHKSFALTFGDMIKRLGDRIEEDGLGEAYE